jgi:AcrR family transcriptional regulator
MGELLASARERLGTDGAANLSLRAVARDLGVSSSAVYRYVESRDALLTLLIIEAYDAVGEVAERAAAGERAAGSPPAQTWLAVARGVP